MKRIVVPIIILIIIVAVIGGVLLWRHSSLSSAQTPATSSPISTPTGLQITDTTTGSGATATDGSTVTVDYTGTLLNGTQFDAHDGFSFKLGAGQVIKGWDEGLVGMKVGGERHLVIPPALGYGAVADGAIPPNSTLVFDVKLVSVQ